MLTAIVAVVGSLQTHSTPAPVHAQYLDRPVTLSIPALVHVRVPLLPSVLSKNRWREWTHTRLSIYALAETFRCLQISTVDFLVRTSAGFVGMPGPSGYHTCTWARMEWVCEEPTTATIAVSTPSNFKPIQQWTVWSYGHWVGYLYEPSCKNSEGSRLQICNREREQEWDHPHFKFQTNSLKSVATSCIVRKRSFLAEKPGVANRDLARSGGGAMLGIGTVVVLLLHCARHCLEIVSVWSYQSLLENR